MWMENIPDHPVIASMERIGEPRARPRRSRPFPGGGRRPGAAGPEKGEAYPRPALGDAGEEAADGGA